jgi:hypothetical protein
VQREVPNKSLEWVSGRRLAAVNNKSHVETETACSKKIGALEI